MDSRIEELLSHQLAAGLPDFAGAQATATIPVADGLLNQLVDRFLPRGGMVRSVVLETHAGDRLTARITLAKPRFLPALTVAVTIEQQATLPESPEIVLKLTGAAALMAFAGSAVGRSNLLPPGVAMQGERIRVNVRTLLRQRGLESLLDHLQELYVTTREGALVLSCRAHVRP
jgi:hypothetical protein